MTTVELAKDFLAYCEANPQQRFWQALRNWSCMAFIYAAHGPDLTKKDDTFYWKNDWCKRKNAAEVWNEDAV